MTHHVRPLSKKLGIQCHILEQAHWKIKSLRILCSSAFLELQSSVPPQWFWIHIFFMSFLLSCPSDTFLSNLCVCRASFPHSFFPSSFFTQKKRGWKSKIFLLLLPLALLLIKRDPRDLLICSSLLEASLLPSFLLTWFSISDLFHFPSTPTLIAPSSLLPTCVPLSKSSRIHAGNLIGNYYLLSLQTKSKQPERAAIWEVLMSNHETMAWLI